MLKKFINQSIPYGRQKIDNQDLNLVKSSIFGKLITTGPFVLRFENDIKKYLKSKYAFTCSSGTAAIHLAFLSIGLKRGDNIIMPAINFIAAYNLAKIMGANIFLADVDPMTGQMSPQNLLNCIKNNKIKKIKAFLTMYLGGHPENIKEFYFLKKKFKCFYIEDACHALGAEYKVKEKTYKVGSCKHSDISTFSLHPLKTITTGEGGIITTINKKISQKISLFRSHGLIKDKKFYWKYESNFPGLNYRLSDINSALGCSQLKKIKLFLKKRSLIAKRYSLGLEKHMNIISLPTYNSTNIPSWHLFLISINFKKISKNKDFFIKYLNKFKIYPQVHYTPIYNFKMVKNFSKKHFPLSELYSKSVVSLPIFVDLSIKNQNHIIAKIEKFIKLYKKKTKNS